MSALTSPISNFSQPEEPAAQARTPPELLAVAETGCQMGMLVMAAATQPGQWPHQGATPGRSTPWLVFSHARASAALPGDTTRMYLSSGVGTAAPSQWMSIPLR